MSSNSFHFTQLSALAVAVAASVGLAACAAPTSPPQQVKSSSPSVTYKYLGDTELIKANQKAEVFCAPYQSVPQTTGFTSEPDGSKVVTFECIKPPVTTIATTTVVAPPSGLTYTYMTDQELVTASRNAQAYCVNTGLTPVISTMTTNLNGSRTVVFQCAAR